MWHSQHRNPVTRFVHDEDGDGQVTNLKLPSVPLVACAHVEKAQRGVLRSAFFGRITSRNAQRYHAIADAYVETGLNACQLCHFYLQTTVILLYVHHLFKHSAS